MICVGNWRSSHSGAQIKRLSEGDKNKEARQERLCRVSGEVSRVSWDWGKPRPAAPSLPQTPSLFPSTSTPFPTAVVYDATEPREKGPFFPLLPRDTPGPARIPTASYSLWRLTCFLFTLVLIYPCKAPVNLLPRHKPTGQTQAQTEQIKCSGPHEPQCSPKKPWLKFQRSSLSLGCLPRPRISWKDVVESPGCLY